jgi:predicted nucleic acid-binding protein
MIVVDSGFLIALFDPECFSGRIDNAYGRVERFLADTTECSGKILIPTPVLTEVLTNRLDRTDEILARLSRQSAVQIVDFDQIIAIEASYVIKYKYNRMQVGQKHENWKVLLKYDAMIAATARVWNARALMTADGDFNAMLEGTGIAIISLEDLPLPAQPDLFSI